MGESTQWQRGLFIVFEGIDGTGKSTQVRLAAEALTGQGYQVETTFEPTQGKYGSRIRELFVHREAVSREEELELFIADRRQHVEKVILPGLAAGKIVISDRYYYSTVAYQGANGLDPDDILARNEAFAPRPDLALFLRIPVSVGLDRIQRLRGETPNSFEKSDYLTRVSDIFDELPGDNIVRLDAMRSAQEVHDRVMAVIFPLVRGRIS